MQENYKTTVVRIMGEEYPIRSDAEPEYLKELANYVEQKIGSVSSKIKLPQRLKTEVLASLLIADDYYTEKKKNEKIEQKLSELFENISAQADKELF
jgi:cell division protein ZapA (FtsZ GTPase activity inhibitor)